MAVSCSIVAHYGGGSLTFATEPSGSGSVNSFYWDASFLNIQDDSALNASGQIYWEVTRQSGTGSDFSATSGTSNISVTFNSGGVVHGFAPVQVFITDDTVDETTGVGENFTVSVYLNSTKTTLYASQTFKLYDADFNISGPAGATVFNITTGATSQNVTFTQPGATESNARQIAVRNASTNAVLLYDTWGATEYYNHTITIANAYLPSAGNSITYYIQVYNGQSYYTVGSNFTINRAAPPTLVAPTSNGAIVSDETVTGNVSVSFNLSNTGSGGTFWAAQTTSSSPAPGVSDSAWNQYTVTDNSTGSVVFSQPRETLRYYWSRRLSGSTQAVGTPTPVTEKVPVNPSISSVSIGSGSHSVIIGSYSPANEPGTSTPITSIFYYQSTSATAMNNTSAWRDSGTDSPPSGWQSSNTFSAVAGTTYYYWILAWTDTNPGPDGASLSTPVSQITTVTGASGVVGQSAGGYGFEVYNASSQLRVGNLDKTSLFLGSHTVTLNSSGQASGIQVPGATSSDCYAIDLSGGAIFGTGLTFTFGTNTLNISGGAAGTISFFVVRA